jgi:hypothetical protein
LGGNGFHIALSGEFVQFLRANPCLGNPDTGLKLQWKNEVGCLGVRARGEHGREENRPPGWLKWGDCIHGLYLTPS